MNFNLMCVKLAGLVRTGLGPLFALLLPAFIALLDCHQRCLDINGLLYIL